MGGGAAVAAAAGAGAAGAASRVDRSTSYNYYDSPQLVNGGAASFVSRSSSRHYDYYDSKQYDKPGGLSPAPSAAGSVRHAGPQLAGSGDGNAAPRTSSLAGTASMPAAAGGLAAGAATGAAAGAAVGASRRASAPGHVYFEDEDSDDYFDRDNAGVATAAGPTGPNATSSAATGGGYFSKAKAGAGAAAAGAVAATASGAAALSRVWSPNRSSNAAGGHTGEELLTALNDIKHIITNRLLQLVDDSTLQEGATGVGALHVTVHELVCSYMCV